MITITGWENQVSIAFFFTCKWEKRDVCYVMVDVDQSIRPFQQRISWLHRISLLRLSWRFHRGCVRR